MNDNQSSEGGDKALLYWTALKYALAGDLESIDALEFLGERIRLIDWTSPSFVEFSSQMREGSPQLNAEQEKALERPLLALLNLVMERNAMVAEGFVKMIPQLQKMNRNGAYMSDVSNGLANFIQEMITLHRSMRDRLETLGAETAEFEPPELSKFLPPPPSE